MAWPLPFFLPLPPESPMPVTPRWAIMKNKWRDDPIKRPYNYGNSGPSPVTQPAASPPVIRQEAPTRSNDDDETQAQVDRHCSPDQSG